MTKAQNFKKPPLGFHSIKGLGKEAPLEMMEVDGIQMASGGIRPYHANSNLKFNEYVVYDIGQVKIRYLFKVKFAFKGSSRGPYN